jgi:hypothetical protein
MHASTMHVWVCVGMQTLCVASAGLQPQATLLPECLDRHQSSLPQQNNSYVFGCTAANRVRHMQTHTIDCKGFAAMGGA